LPISGGKKHGVRTSLRRFRLIKRGRDFLVTAGIFGRMEVEDAWKLRTHGS